MVSRTLARAAGFLGSVEGKGASIGEHESSFRIFLCVLFSVPELDSGAGCCGIDLPSCASAIECGMSTRYIFLSWKRIAVSCIIPPILGFTFPSLGDGENER